VPAYLLLAAASDAANAGTPDPQAAISALAFVVSGIPTVLLVLLLVRFLRPTVGEGWALVIGLGYGLGSIAFPFATMYFGHAASAFFLFASFYLLWRWKADHRGWRPVLAGVLAGCAVLTEIPVGLGVVILGLYALWLGRGQVLRFILGGIPIGLVLMAYNWQTFGGPFTLGYQYATLFGEQNRQGIVSIVWPSLTTTADLLLGPRGLLRLAPWICLAPLGLLAYRQRAVRAEVVVSVAICGAFLAYNSGALNPFGGWTPGPRYLLPALPFAAILVALAPPVFRLFTTSLIAVAIVVFFVATATMPNAPEMYRDPLFELWLPRLLNRDIADTIAWVRWGLHGIQPLLVLVPAVALAITVLAATFRWGSAASRVIALPAGALVLLIVATALPLVPASAFVAGGSAERTIGAVAVVEVGVTPAMSEDRARLVIWAQAENRGLALDDSRVVFTVLAPDGSPTWSGWLDDVSWRAGERKRAALEWNTETVQGGDYRVEVAILSKDLETVYASGVNASLVRIRP
jgi:hypothetical protein